MIDKLQTQKQAIESTDVPRLEQEIETLARTLDDTMAKQKTVQGQLEATTLQEEDKSVFAVYKAQKQNIEELENLAATLQQQKRAEESKLAEYSMPELKDATVMTWVHQDRPTSSARETALKEKLAGGPLDHPSRPSQNPFFDDTLTLRRCASPRSRPPRPRKRNTNA